MISKYLKERILVMIDAANLESVVKSLNWWIDYLKLRDLFKNNGFKLITKPLKIIKA